jgi:hypothetical protein
VIRRFFADVRDIGREFRLEIERLEKIGEDRVIAFLEVSASGFRVPRHPAERPRGGLHLRRGCPSGAGPLSLTCLIEGAMEGRGVRDSMLEAVFVNAVPADGSPGLQGLRVLVAWLGWQRWAHGRALF